MNRIAGFVAIVLDWHVRRERVGHSRRMTTLAQARTLVLAPSLPRRSGCPASVRSPYQDPNSSRFLFFTVTWAAGPKQSLVVGNYAVDPYTGDVWSCHVQLR